MDARPLMETAKVKMVHKDPDSEVQVHSNVLTLDVNVPNIEIIIAFMRHRLVCMSYDLLCEFSAALIMLRMDDSLASKAIHCIAIRQPCTNERLLKAAVQSMFFHGLVDLKATCTIVSDEDSLLVHNWINFQVEVISVSRCKSHQLKSHTCLPGVLQQCVVRSDDGILRVRYIEVLY